MSGAASPEGRTGFRDGLLIGALGLAWGLNWPAARLALTELPPLTFRAVGFSAAALGMFGFLLATGRSPAVPRHQWGRLFAVGLLSTVAYNVFSAAAMIHAPTSRAAVLSYTMPLWTVLFARIVVGEPVDRYRAAGLALGVAGLAALGLPLVAAGELTIGLAYAVLSGLVWAAGSVTLKRWPVNASPLVITAWQLLLGAVLTGAGMALFDGWPRLPAATATWLGLGYNIVVGQCLATTLWFTMLGLMPAGRAAIGSLLVPGIGVVGAALVLGERPGWADWAGLALIVAASASVMLRSGPARTDGATRGDAAVASPRAAE